MTRKLNIHYIACIGSLISLLSTRVYLSFAVHKLAKFSSNPGKINFERLVHFLKHIRYNNTLVLKYYADMIDEPLSDLLIKSNINTENHFMAFYDSNWNDCPDTGRSTGAYILFYQGKPIDHVTLVPVPVDHSSAESEYNSACTTGMDLEHFRMLIH